MKIRSITNIIFIIFSDGSMTNTDYPVKRYTGQAIHYTQPAMAISPLSKSTRHLSIPEPDVVYYYTNTVDRKNLKHGKNQSFIPKKYNENKFSRQSHSFSRNSKFLQNFDLDFKI